MASGKSRWLKPGWLNTRWLRGRWWWILLAMVAIGLVALALQPQVVAVDTAVVERGPLAVTIDEEGETRVRDRYVVSAPVAGRVLRIELEAGDPVVAGDTALATFEPRGADPLDPRSRAEAEANVGAAQAALGEARAERQRVAAELAQARQDLARVRRLADEEIVAADRLEAATLAVRTAEEAVSAADFRARSAEQRVAAARAALVEGAGGATGAPLVLRSPIDGVVLRLLRESETIVAAGEPLLEVGDPAQLEIVSDLLSRDAVQVSAGDPVRIEDWGGGEVLAGRVRRVEPSGFTKVSALGVEEQRVNVLVDFADPEAAWQRLGDGFRVEVRIVVWQSDAVLRVPIAALFRGIGAEGGWAAFAVRDGRAELRAVEIGQRTDRFAEVLSGLEAGERVVLHPSDDVAAGVEVAVEPTS